MITIFYDSPYPPVGLSLEEAVNAFRSISGSAPIKMAMPCRKCGGRRWIRRWFKKYPCDRCVGVLQFTSEGLTVDPDYE